MKIAKINLLNNDIFFGAKKAGRNTGKSKTEKPQGNGDRKTQGKLQAANKKAYYPGSYYYKNERGPVYLDIAKISSIVLPESTKAKPAPFETTDMTFDLDNYQKEAIDSFASGQTTIVSAPTGTGKTLIAEYAIYDALKSGKKIIYLSPLKALSNEKYNQFSRLFGNYDENSNLVDTANVGLMTGDVTINPDAPLMVMTTEIYRNSLMTSSSEETAQKYQDYSGVIYDEFHYLGEKERGIVWEESVMFTPKHMKQLMLSATASNAKDVENWIQSLNGDIKTHLVNVPETERHVPLNEYILEAGGADGLPKLKIAKTKMVKFDDLKAPENLTERQKKAYFDLMDITGACGNQELVDKLQGLTKSKFGLRTDDFAAALIKKYGVDKDIAYALPLILASRDIEAKYPNSETVKFPEDCSTMQVVDVLNKEKMTPALFYIFSKKGCDKELIKAAKDMPSLLTKEESKMVWDEINKCKEDGIFLGSDFDGKQIAALMKGYAAHHAGKLPAYKSLVENLARKGLVKICFATETLLAGINMPFKTTVFTSLEKFDGDFITNLSVASFKQGAGRAGRRGKDNIGNVVIMARYEDEYQKYVECSKSTDTRVKSRYALSYASILSNRFLNNRSALNNTFFAYQYSKGTNRIKRMQDAIDEKMSILRNMGYIELQDDGKYVRTEKGDTAKNIHGINEILLTEMLFDENCLKDAKKEDLIAIAAFLSDVKDENPSWKLNNERLKPMEKRMELVFDLITNINLFEDKDFMPSTNITPYVLQFSEAPSDREGALQTWTNVMNDMKNRKLMVHGGDFLRLVNGTIDILKMIAELSPDENVRNEAALAINSLRKPPVKDIQGYELGLDI